MEQRRDLTMIHRRGATLVEVLVAIFVTAIGLLALLALFPLGAVSMAQALKDNRCAQCAANAMAIAPLQQLNGQVGQGYKQKASAAAIYHAFYNPGSISLPDLSNPLIYPGYSGPSYPVYVDPVGVLLSSSAWFVQDTNSSLQVAVAGLGNTITRLSPGYANVMSSQPTPSIPSALKWFTLLDDINFGTNGLPLSSPLQREGRYSWAYMLQYPVISFNSASQPDKAVVRSTVVVYSGRSQAVLGENNFAGVTLTAGSTQITIPQSTWGSSGQPALRNGSWILDASFFPNKAPGWPDIHCSFYRVIDVQLDSTGLVLELQTPLKQSSQPQAGTIVVMDNVVEVLER